MGKNLVDFWVLDVLFHLKQGSVFIGVKFAEVGMHVVKLRLVEIFEELVVLKLILVEIL